jgi:hypothetical protein
MTAFELWKAGMGPEPVVIGPRTSSWSSWLLSSWRTPSPIERHEETEAAEEMRAALERAIALDRERITLILIGLIRVRRMGDNRDAWLDIPIADLEAVLCAGTSALVADNPNPQTAMEQ